MMAIQMVIYRISDEIIVKVIRGTSKLDCKTKYLKTKYAKDDGWNKYKYYFDTNY